MEVNQLILLVKKKVNENILTQNIIIKDKTYLHTKHSTHQLGKFHLELIIKSKELKKYSKVEATKKIYKILDKEIKEQIHSIQILIN
tara:strand:- start:2210 stop:2470 length:261 start_codon:yes stop_codon:yes gene_type:complete